MVRRTLLLVALIICISSVPGAAVSNPAVEGDLIGVELCPQSFCGAAVFAAYFIGHVDSVPTRGLAWAGINHEDLPTEEGDTAAITGGVWSIRTWRGRFSGIVSGGTLTNNGDETYTVALAMVMQGGGEGELTFLGMLDHTPLPDSPPTITGTIYQ